MPKTDTLPEAFVEALGRSVDDEERGGMLRFAAGNMGLTLRRDCHGVLRRVELNFPDDARAGVAARLARLGAWVELAPQRLALLDLPAVGRMLLASDRLEMTLRLRFERAAVVEIVEPLVALAQGA